MALTKQCRCGVKISIQDTCCSKCVSYYVSKRKEQYKMYDATKRDKKAASFYCSKEWLTLRPVIFSKTNYIDIYLYYTKGIISQADTIHHIVEIKEDWSRRLDITNLIPLTEKSHRTIHKLYNSNKASTQQLLFDLLIRWENEMK